MMSGPAEVGSSEPTPMPADTIPNNCHQGVWLPASRKRMRQRKVMRNRATRIAAAASTSHRGAALAMVDTRVGQSTMNPRTRRSVTLTPT